MLNADTEQESFANCHQKLSASRFIYSEDIGIRCRVLFKALISAMYLK